MKKFSMFALFVVALALQPLPVYSQAVPIATDTRYANVGVALSLGSSDEVYGHIGGITAYFDAGKNSYLGFELSANENMLRKPHHFGEATYLLGPRAFYTNRRLSNVHFFDATGFGFGRTKTTGGITTQAVPGHTYGVIANTVGLDVKVHNFIIRPIAWRYEYWPRFYDAGQPAHSYYQQGSALNPTFFTFGVAYSLKDTR
jgi:hypothetical protein